MTKQTTPPQEAAKLIDAYIAAAPGQGQKLLIHLRNLLKELAPEAKENIKWGSPVFEEKRILFSMMAYKKHLSFMPTRRTLDHFRDEIKGYAMGKDTLQISYDQELPVELITKLAKHRIHDVRENDAKWM